MASIARSFSVGASVAKAAGTRSITYDNRGNTSAETRPGSVSVATTYDGHGRLTGYTRTGDPSQSNVYNGLDDRVTVTSGSTTTRFLYAMDGRVLAEYGASATNVVAEHIWMQPEAGNDNGPFATDDGSGGYAPIAVVNGTTVSWVHGNHLGTPAVYTSATGAVVVPAAHTVPGFPGQLRTLSDLYYNRYRDYDSSTGRYIQADPIGLEGGSNAYFYADGNPLTKVDPEGLQSAVAIGKVVVPILAERAALPSRKLPVVGAALRAGDLIGTGLAVAWFVYKQRDCPPLFLKSGGRGTDGRDDGYSEQYYRDLTRCRNLKSKSAKARCFPSAELREAKRRNGISEGSLPPLIEW